VEQGNAGAAADQRDVPGHVALVERRVISVFRVVHDDGRGDRREHRAVRQLEDIALSGMVVQ
jgi:hypothetical protein